MAFHLFEAFGVELEYMIIQKDSLQVLSIADKILLNPALGNGDGDIENGNITWSNELVKHVIEFKNNNPAKTLNDLADSFSTNIQQVNLLLQPFNACLMPTAMHPFMSPDTEMELWDYEYNEVYKKYNEIFNCKGHGWSNLQSVHLNLPFHGDIEFGRLHTAIRLILPILPALAASSPIKEAKYTGFADSRLYEYQFNQKKIPSIAGSIIPEQVFTKEDYYSQILHPIFRDIAPFDENKILQEEWLNSRGAIARFQRDTIEIRLLDIQECPQADIAILKLIIEVIQSFCEEKWCSLENQQTWAIEPLSDIYKKCIKDGENTWIENKDYLKLFGCQTDKICAGHLWQFLLNNTISLTKDEVKTIELIGKKGTLSTRIKKSLGENPTLPKIKEEYRKLTECLKHNLMFQG